MLIAKFNSSSMQTNTPILTIEKNCVHASHVIWSISVQLHRKEVTYPYLNKVLLSSSNIRKRVFGIESLCVHLSRIQCIVGIILFAQLDFGEACIF
jgi:hypothetical protein